MLFKCLSTFFTLLVVSSGNMIRDTNTVQFSNFIKIYNKEYTDSELIYRMSVYSDNIRKIDDHNNAGHSWKMAVNQFADLTVEEFKSGHTCLEKRNQVFRKSTLNFNEIDFTPVEDLPASFDWTEKGAVTPVKDQGQCGSCWAFSSTGSAEGAYAIATGKLVSLSEQQLVDCSGSYGNQGCNGGIYFYSWDYAEKSALCSESDYSYTGVDGKCKKCTGVTTVDSYVEVTPNSETALQQAVSLGPVSIAIEADTSVFQFYSSGVMDSTSCGTNLDHAVLVTGWGDLNGKKYWNVKNSWGSSWGTKGYILLGRNSNNKSGVCGLAMEPGYPVISSKI